MARKPKFEPIGSRNFEVVTVHEDMADCSDTAVTAWVTTNARHWYVRNRETCASTQPSTDLEAYYKLKRVWRRSKEDFDSACRFMDFGDLFSTAGVKL